MKEYAVIYEWTGENYSAYVPDLPGCVACGDTVEETEDLLHRSPSRRWPTDFGADDESQVIGGWSVT